MSLPSLPRWRFNVLTWNTITPDPRAPFMNCYIVLERMNYQPLERLCRYIPVMAEVVTQWRSMLLYNVMHF